MATVELLRRRRAEVQQADDARNTLLDDLLQKVDDMQKTMDRNAFIMVLIDGDCMTVSTTSLQLSNEVASSPYVLGQG